MPHPYHIGSATPNRFTTLPAILYENNNAIARLKPDEENGFAFEWLDSDGSERFREFIRALDDTEIEREVAGGDVVVPPQFLDEMKAIEFVGGLLDEREARLGAGLVKRTTLYRLKEDEENRYRVAPNPYTPEMRNALILVFGDTLERIYSEEDLGQSEDTLSSQMGQGRGQDEVRRE